MEKIPFLPETRNHVLSLLRCVRDDLDQLTPEQIAAIKRIYRIDGSDERVVADLVRDGVLIP